MHTSRIVVCKYGGTAHLSSKKLQIRKNSNRGQNIFIHFKIKSFHTINQAFYGHLWCSFQSLFLHKAVLIVWNQWLSTRLTNCVEFHFVLLNLASAPSFLSSDLHVHWIGSNLWFHCFVFEELWMGSLNIVQLSSEMDHFLHILILFGWFVLSFLLLYHEDVEIIY